MLSVRYPEITNDAEAWGRSGPVIGSTQQGLARFGGRDVGDAFPEPAPFSAPTGGIASPRRELAIRGAEAAIAEG